MNKKYINELSKHWYSSKHPVHGPYNPNKDRVKFLTEAQGQEEMRQLVEQEARLAEEEAGGGGEAGSAGAPVVLTGQTFADLVEKSWEEISNRTWADI